MNRREFLRTGALAAAAVFVPLDLRIAAAPNQTYTMVTFVSEIDYWKDCFRGMQDAADFLDVTANYVGSRDNEQASELQILDQTIRTRPDGILLTAINPDGLKSSIDTAIQAGIGIVTFDADSPLSKRYSFVGTGNMDAGVVAARYLGPIVQAGKIAISSVPAQLNHIQRRQGFIDTLKTEFKNIIVTDQLIVDNANDASTAASTMITLLTANPDIKGIFATDASGAIGVAQALQTLGITTTPIVGFDYDERTLDLVDNGSVLATLAQGTWQMGFWGLIELFMVRNQMIKSVSDWQTAGIAPLPPTVDTGVAVITKSNSHYWR